MCVYLTVLGDENGVSGIFGFYSGKPPNCGFRLLVEEFRRFVESFRRFVEEFRQTAMGFRQL
ncbi:hypothetical protein AB7942_15290 [Neobacillus sp. BF23-41]|uniref:hypothetical protein n=1 Tax=Neobacillus sp. BF23-41 TaxID=3240280 RepID=UPI0034E5C83F